MSNSQEAIVACLLSPSVPVAKCIFLYNEHHVEPALHVVLPQHPSIATLHCVDG